MLQNHKARWTDRDLQPCPLCGEPESRDHLVCHCEGTRDLVAAHDGTVAEVRSDAPWLIALPLAYKHPEHQALLVQHWSHAFPEPFVSTCETNDNVPVFYTDASSFEPQEPFGSIAAWAIVEDLAENDADRATASRHFRETYRVPNNFHCVQSSTVHGNQTVARAELVAIVQVIRSCETAIIVTDSKYARDLVVSIQKCPHEIDFLKAENFDVIVHLCEIFRTKDPADFLVLKIKAHQTVSPCNADFADLDNYAILGNTAVDFAAKSAANYNNNRLHQQAREVLDFYKKQRRLRGKFLDLTIEIDKTRMDACDKRKAQANKDAKHSCSPTNLLEWHPRGGVQLHVPVLNDDQLSGCPWGSAFTCLVLEWAQTLRWPVEQAEHDPGSPLLSC